MNKHQDNIELREFLKSNGNDSVRCIDGYTIVKMNFSDDFILIYRAGYKETFRFKDELQCIGFYNKKTDNIYTLGMYPFDETDEHVVPFFYSVKAGFDRSIIDKFNEWVNSISKEDATNVYNSISDDCSVDSEDCLVKEAGDAIIAGFTSTTYNNNKDFVDDTDIVLDVMQSCLLTNNDSSVFESVLSNLKEKLHRTVYLNVYTKYKVIEKIIKFESDPSNDVFKLRDMRHNLSLQMQMVRLTINKNGKVLSFKYPVDSLYYRLGNSWLSVFAIPAQERQTYHEMFGNEDLKPLDIVKIEYGKKVLYQAN